MVGCGRTAVALPLLAAYPEAVRSKTVYGETPLSVAVRAIPRYPVSLLQRLQPTRLKLSEAQLRHPIKEEARKAAIAREQELGLLPRDLKEFHGVAAINEAMARTLEQDVFASAVRMVRWMIHPHPLPTPGRTHGGWLLASPACDSAHPRASALTWAELMVARLQTAPWSCPGSGSGAGGRVRQSGQPCDGADQLLQPGRAQPRLRHLERHGRRRQPDIGLTVLVAR